MAANPSLSVGAKPAARVVDVFLDYLRAEGVRLVFGVPGGLLFPLFEAVEHSGDVRLVVTKHEEGAAFMADGYARVSGTLGVCAGCGGPGSTNRASEQTDDPRPTRQHEPSSHEPLRS